MFTMILQRRAAYGVVRFKAVVSPQPLEEVILDNYASSCRRDDKRS
jgi:hypothetical protein